MPPAAFFCSGTQIRQHDTGKFETLGRMDRRQSHSLIVRHVKFGFRLQCLAIRKAFQESDEVFNTAETFRL
ncbi:hypothetical protein D3C83_151520 [compost metagenome]